MEKLTEHTEIFTLSLDAIKQSYEVYRLPNVSTQDHLTQSMELYGQISPVVVCPSKKVNEFELIDGFKRLKVARKLELKTIKAKLLKISIRACKAAIMQLNWIKNTVKPFEEALILHSLFHDDGLTQVEISKLINRHTSWVSRRISLIERLCEEVKEQIKIGLVTVSTGRELAKLPCGNQEAALNTIQKYGFCCRETERLVSLLLSKPRYEGDAILNFPAIILEDRVEPKPSKKPKKQKLNEAIRLEKKLEGILTLCSVIVSMVHIVKNNDISDAETQRLKKITTHAITQAKNCVVILEEFQQFLNIPPF
ncbi:MAG: ParB N-terminal domain-containing protein [Desulfobacterales bacterium]|nr:ParB N-terminal domain-containing protein [Desulfobacterales bacterium]